AERDGPGATVRETPGPPRTMAALPGAVMLRRPTATPTGRRTRGRNDAALPIQVPLHVRNVGQADRQSRSPSEGRSVVHPVGRWEARWILVRLRHTRLGRPPDKRVHGRGCAGDSGGGALSSFETTVLLTVGETIDALARPSKSSTKRPARRSAPRLVEAKRPCWARRRGSTDLVRSLVDQFSERWLL